MIRHHEGEGLVDFGPEDVGTPVTSNNGVERCFDKGAAQEDILPFGEVLGSFSHHGAGVWFDVGRLCHLVVGR